MTHIHIKNIKIKYEITTDVPIDGSRIVVKHRRKLSIKLDGNYPKEVFDAAKDYLLKSETK